VREGAQHPICAAGAHCMTGVQQCLDERVLYLVWLRYIRFYETSDERVQYTQRYMAAKRRRRMLRAMSNERREGERRD
jgi:hypothetical protein